MQSEPVDCHINQKGQEDYSLQSEYSLQTEIQEAHPIPPNPSHIPPTAYSAYLTFLPLRNIQHKQQQKVGFPSFHRREIVSGNSKSTCFTPSNIKFLF